MGDGADDSPPAGVAKAGTATARTAFIGVGMWTVLAVVDIGKLQDTVTTWTPVAWLNTTRAFSPLARQSHITLRSQQ